MVSRGSRIVCARGESGQAALLLLGVMAALLLGVVVLAAFGQALGAKGRHQRAADLAAMSAAAAMRDVYPRLFEPALLEDGVPNPQHLSLPAYMALARDTALRVGRSNGVALRAADVRFPGGSFAPTRVTVIARGSVHVHVGDQRRPVAVRGRATAELAPSTDATLEGDGAGSGGGYDGPLAYRMGMPMRPDVALAFDRMAAAARRDGIYLSITSAFRRTPSRRGCSPRTRTPSGSRHRGRAFTATERSSTSAPRLPTPGSPPTPAASASSTGTREPDRVSRRPD